VAFLAIKYLSLTGFTGNGLKMGFGKAMLVEFPAAFKTCQISAE
jgi:hypothetical protein